MYFGTKKKRNIVLFPWLVTALNGKGEGNFDLFTIIPSLISSILF